MTRVPGFEGGELPRNASARFNKYVAQHADDFTKQTIKSVTLDRKASKDVRGLMVVYLYLTQPGGSAEKVWLNLRENGRIPGDHQGRERSVDCIFQIRRDCRAGLSAVAHPDGAQARRGVRLSPHDEAGHAGE